MSFYSWILQNNFAIEFILSFIPSIPVLKRRKYWYLILLPFVGGLLVISSFTFWRITRTPIWVNALWYLGAFVWAVFAVRLGFKINWWQAIYTVTCSYTIQHTFYKISRLSDCFFVNFSNGGLLSHIFNFPILIAVYFVFYLIFVRTIKKQKNLEINNLKVLIITVIVLFVEIYVNLLFEGYFYSVSLFYSQYSVFFAVFGIVCCLLILRNLYDNIYNVKVEEELRILNTLWENDKRQYEIFKSSVDMLNIKYHDLKYSLKAMNAADPEKNQWVKETIDTLDVFGSMQKTGSEALDVILVGLQPQCREAGISLKVTADGTLLGFMNDIDVYSLMGNALDNAVECVRNEISTNEKYITVTVKQCGAMVKIQVENPVSKPVKIVNGFPVTTKSDYRNHGFGVKSMALIVERYGGICHFDYSENKFILEIMLPL